MCSSFVINGALDLLICSLVNTVNALKHLNLNALVVFLNINRAISRIASKAKSYRSKAPHLSTPRPPISVLHFHEPQPILLPAKF